MAVVNTKDGAGAATLLITYAMAKLPPFGVVALNGKKGVMSRRLFRAEGVDSSVVMLSYKWSAPLPHLHPLGFR